MFEITMYENKIHCKEMVLNDIFSVTKVCLRNFHPKATVVHSEWSLLDLDLVLLHVQYALSDLGVYALFGPRFFVFSP